MVGTYVCTDRLSMLEGPVGSSDVRVSLLLAGTLSIVTRQPGLLQHYSGVTFGWC